MLTLVLSLSSNSVFCSKQRWKRLSFKDCFLLFHIFQICIWVLLHSVLYIYRSRAGHYLMPLLTVFQWDHIVIHKSVVQIEKRKENALNTILYLYRKCICKNINKIHHKIRYEIPFENIIFIMQFNVININYITWPMISHELI